MYYVKNVGNNRNLSSLNLLSRVFPSSLILGHNREARGFIGLVYLHDKVGMGVEEEEENGCHGDEKEEEGGFDYARIETGNSRIFSFFCYLNKIDNDDF